MPRTLTNISILFVRSIRSRRALSIVFAVAASMIISIDVLSPGTEPVQANVGLSPINKSAPALPEPEPLNDETPARGKFLVANRNLVDPRFQETVILLIDYSAEGAAGLIINRPTKVPLSDLLPSVPGLKERSDVAYYGGPVEGRQLLMLIRSDERPEESGRVFGNVYVSASRDTLVSVIGSRKTEK